MIEYDRIMRREDVETTQSKAKEVFPLLSIVLVQFVEGEQKRAGRSGQRD